MIRYVGVQQKRTKAPTNSSEFVITIVEEIRAPVFGVTEEDAQSDTHRVPDRLVLELEQLR
jgi:hypothetical protein